MKRIFTIFVFVFLGIFLLFQDRAYSNTEISVPLKVIERLKVTISKEELGGSSPQERLRTLKSQYIEIYKGFQIFKNDMKKVDRDQFETSFQHFKDHNWQETERLLSTLAKRISDEGLESFPLSKNLYVMLGNLVRIQGDHEGVGIYAAERSILDEEIKHKRGYDLFNEGHYNEAIDIYIELRDRKLLEHKAWQNYIRLNGEEMNDSSDVEEAKWPPRSLSYIYWMLARCYSDLNEPEKALSNFQEGLPIFDHYTSIENKDFDLFLREYAYVLREEGKIDDFNALLYKYYNK
ncbi:MAG: hypothetical protein HWE30_07660 [Methylocystaceae bacterium]|nr:hypothetical protein [Methylocystaceae bacterium]